MKPEEMHETSRDTSMAHVLNVTDMAEWFVGKPATNSTGVTGDVKPGGEYLIGRDQ